MHGAQQGGPLCCGPVPCAILEWFRYSSKTEQTWKLVTRMVQLPSRKPVAEGIPRLRNCCSNTVRINARDEFDRTLS